MNPPELTMSWRDQVNLREHVVKKLLEVCGEYEARRRLGEDGRRLRPLSRRIDGILTLESTLDQYLYRPVGEGSTVPAPPVRAR